MMSYSSFTAKKVPFSPNLFTGIKKRKPNFKTDQKQKIKKNKGERVASLYFFLKVSLPKK